MPLLLACTTVPRPTMHNRPRGGREGDGSKREANSADRFGSFGETIPSFVGIGGVRCPILDNDSTIYNAVDFRWRTWGDLMEKVKKMEPGLSNHTHLLMCHFSKKKHDAYPLLDMRTAPC